MIAQPVLHDWCNKGRGVYYPVCGMMHIKEPLLLIRKRSLCGGCRFPLSLSEWSFLASLMNAQTSAVNTDTKSGALVETTVSDGKTVARAT